MKIMIVWRTVPGKYKAALEAFLRSGGPVPAGAKTIGRWHVPGSCLAGIWWREILRRWRSTWRNGQTCWSAKSTP